MSLSSLKFASFLSYKPKYEGHKDLISAIKQDKIHPKRGLPVSEAVAQDVKEKIENFKDFFGPEVYLVPVPKSVPIKQGMLWVPERIARELEKVGLGRFFDCLERIEPVKKSSSSDSKERLKPADHYKTIRVNPKIERPEKIVLVDDVITRGSTFLGCADLVSEAFPEAEIKSFAAIRAISSHSYFKKIEDIHIGLITRSPDGTCSTT